MVTGGAGFIGSALVRHLIEQTDHHVLNFDKLTYSASPAALAATDASPRYRFVRGDIADSSCVAQALEGFRPNAIVNLAAETHVDRSIDSPAEFVRTNLLGTFTLLEQSRLHLRDRPQAERAEFRFHHVSTDEVFGSLGPEGCFDEESAYQPRSPYSASKAGADHLVRAWGHTYGLPVLVSNCTNNYGPWQFPEKLIPLTIARALSGVSLPIYGDGGQRRDWLFVEDHVLALRRVFEAGIPGETYAISGGCEQSNLAVVQAVCARLDRVRPLPGGASHAERIEFVDDRPGHDRRYALDSSKITQELGWRPATGFEEGIDRTVDWYLANEPWWRGLVHEGWTERAGLAAASAPAEREAEA